MSAQKGKDLLLKIISYLKWQFVQSAVARPLMSRHLLLLMKEARIKLQTVLLLIDNLEFNLKFLNHEIFRGEWIIF